VLPWNEELTQILDEEPEGKRPKRRPRGKRLDNIKKDISH
jgi:hypothetical protein